MMAATQDACNSALASLATIRQHLNQPEDQHLSPHLYAIQHLLEAARLVLPTAAQVERRKKRSRRKP